MPRSPKTDSAMSVSVPFGNRFSPALSSASWKRMVHSFSACSSSWARLCLLALVEPFSQPHFRLALLLELAAMAALSLPLALSLELPLAPSLALSLSLALLLASVVTVAVAVGGGCCCCCCCYCFGVCRYCVHDPYSSPPPPNHRLFSLVLGAFRARF